ncbi:MAG: ribonuclease HII [Parcubacteria group bacterium]|jgi:ribonuclease HII
MIIANFEHEENLLASGYDFVLGIDEAGRGPLAGPVVASVAAIKDFRSLDLTDKRWNFIRDSKALSEKQREVMFDFIHEHFYVGVGICDHLTVDRINVLEASFLSMKKALTDLQNQQKDLTRDKKCIVLVDGNKLIPSFSLEQLAIVSGDKLVKSIAAASIIAKVTRDRMICEADKIYPEYGFSKHKGYGTKMHMEALKKHGPCPIHRQSFEPMKGWTNRAKGCYYKGVKYQINP